jgi:hypothetical protein
VEPPTGGANRAIRITGIRVNANSAANLAPLTAFITTTRNLPNTGELTVTNNNFTVGVAQTGLVTSLRSRSDGSFSVVNILQCIGLNTSLSTTSSGNVNANFNIRFEEQIPNAFKRFGEEVAPVNSGTVTPVSTTGGTANTIPTTFGKVTNGTRLRAVFNNIPAGVRIFVTNNVVANGTTALGSVTSRAILLQTDANGANLFAFTGTDPLAGSPAGSPVANSTGTIESQPFGELTVTGGSATAIWEVVNDDPGARENLSFGVALRASVGSTAPGTATLGGSFAPIAPGTSGRTSLRFTDAFGLIPRFADTATPANAFTFGACVTNLLFPYVTSQQGFNTGVAISNTSQDTGTAGGFTSSNNAQAGSCTINWFGRTTGSTALPAANTTQSIPAGRVLTFTLIGANTATPNSLDSFGMPDSPAPNFVGYIIATCNFRFGHGFAFITDGHLNQFGAMGYLALVLDTTSGSRTTSASEVLGQ